jgi:hypothetical protein
MPADGAMQRKTMNATLGQRWRLKQAEFAAWRCRQRVFAAKLSDGCEILSGSVRGFCYIIAK